MEHTPTPTQQEILDFVATMQTPVVIKGAAGSGKSEITRRISRIFAEQQLPEGNKIGVVTYTETLVRELKEQLQDAPCLHVDNAHEMFNAFLEKNGRTRLEKEHFVPAWDVANRLAGVDGAGHYDGGFLEAEFAWLDRQRITSPQQYQNTPRTGLGAAPADYEQVWKLFCLYKERIRAAGLYTYDEVANLCLDIMAQNPDYPRPFTHLIIDEFQDLARNDIEALVKLCKYPEKIVFVGDLAQSIYMRGLSWKDFDIEHKKVFELRDNFRNSKQIAAAAENLLDNEYKLKLYDRQDYTEMISSDTDGPKPVVAFCHSKEEQLDYVSKEIGRIDPTESIAIFMRTNKELEGMPRTLRGPGITLLTMHSCKGLEFDNVFILNANEGNLPHRVTVEKHKDRGVASERRLLYVAMTRARKRLFIVASGKPSRFLAEISPSRISPVALDYQAYENLYKTHRDELVEKLEQVTKTLIQKTEELKQQKEANKQLAELKCSEAFYGERAREISDGLPPYRRDAKILILGGDGGMKEKVLVYTLKEEFGLGKDNYEWIHFDQMSQYKAANLQGCYTYTDIILGCIPHNGGGFEDLAREFRNHGKDYPARIHILSAQDGGLLQLTKTNLIQAVKESNLLKMRKRPL